MEWFVFNFLSSAISIIAICSALILTIAFWRLKLVSGTAVSRLGLGATLANLGVWLIYGMIWCISLLPYEMMEPLYRILEIPFLWESLWFLGTAATVTSLLCLAWTLYRGIQPAPQVP